MTALESPPPTRRRLIGRLPAVIALVCLLAGLGFAAFRSFHALTRPSAATLKARAERSAAVQEALAPHVQYRVSGTSTEATLIVLTPSGPATLEHVRIPLQTKTGLPYLEFTMKHGDSVGMEVRPEDGKTVTCTVTVGSRTLSTGTSSGPGQSATCGASVP